MLNSLEYELTKIRPTFAKPNISKIEIIKRCKNTTCSMNLIFLTEKKIRTLKLIFDVEKKSTLKKNRCLINQKKQ